jgi:23S rRNA (adenine-N6)-dimethyltransferase
MPDHRTARSRRPPAAGEAPQAKGGTPRAVRRRVLSQNFLIDRRAIAGLVDGSGVSDGDLVVDVGAGNGLITEALRRRGARVMAIERDPALARRLRAKFSADQEVSVVEGNVLTTPLPGEPYLVVANIPFGITTKILRHLLRDPTGQLRRADVIVQAEVARKRGTRGRGKRGHGTLLNACWEPWFEFDIGQWLPRTAFRPQPGVDAAVLIVRRRAEPLLDPAAQADYAEFVSSAFAGAHPTVSSALARKVPLSRFITIATELGFGVGALPGQLAAEHWVALFQAARGERARRGEQGHRSASRAAAARAGRF